MFKKKTIFNSDLPEGVSIVDEAGGIHVSPFDTWNSGLGYTGIGINSEGHSFIMAIADNPQDQYSSDLSINTNKMWRTSDAMGTGTVKTLEQAILDFNSKKNTDTWDFEGSIVEAVMTARNYSRGCIGKGQWDLPACGILNIIKSLTSAIVEVVRTKFNNTQWINRYGGNTHPYIWSSNLQSIGYQSSAWALSFGGSGFYSLRTTQTNSNVVPIYTIK